MCKVLHTLPEEGGLLNQDPDWILILETVFRIQNELEEQRQKRDSRAAGRRAR